MGRNSISAQPMRRVKVHNGEVTSGVYLGMGTHFPDQKIVKLVDNELLGHCLTLSRSIEYLY